MSHKTLLITGAGARVGRYLAKGLARDGWAVGVHYNRSKDGADALVSDITASGGQAAAIQANLNVPAELDTLMSRTAKALGPVTALINNASTFAGDEIGSFSRGSYDHHMDVNLRAPLHLSQQLAAQLPDDADGCILNILDQRVLKPNPEFLTYSISKAGLFWATKTMAQALAPRIRVNGIGPGPTLSNARQSAEDFETQKSATLLGEGSPPEEILRAARYLLGAKAVTGQMIAVDGGQHLTWKTPDIWGIKE